MDPRETAVVKLQSVWRGHALRSTGVSQRLKKRRTELDAVWSAAEAEAVRFEPWVFEEGLEAKQLNGIPVPLIEYEEKLLQQQLKLDGMQSSGAGSDVMRHWRRAVNSKLQAKLNRVDACREEWQRAGQIAAATA
jgi:hypothetical protein